MSRTDINQSIEKLCNSDYNLHKYIITRLSLSTIPNLNHNLFYQKALKDSNSSSNDEESLEERKLHELDKSEAIVDANVNKHNEPARTGGSNAEEKGVLLKH